ncbi:hypothetical protein BUALT_Bualt05G0062700 [Buddleja alternifolia]|uniref:Alkyl transferase n=1 Tax=Buddleja alternifolia TaxID=168488 RepID=A0AAV6XNY3_9LAMI|nr:hypothetical protein BUALT_Bualt05G0062700 [Buddleja alternifolia]
MNDDISKVVDDGRASIMKIEEDARKKEEEREKRNIENPLFSSLKLCNPPRKIGDNRQNIRESFSPPISRSRLAATSDSNDETDNNPKSPIQFVMPGDLRPELMPKHVALIMDGHGRWAKNRGLPIEDGHYAGLQNLKQLILNCRKLLGIKVLTVYAFSTENWNRSKGEVDFLMSHFEDFIQSFVKEQTMGQDLRFSVIGDKSRLPRSLQSTISSVEESAKFNRGMHFMMALSYGARYEITEASKKIASKVENGILRTKDINETVFEQHMLTSVTEFPNPDLLIRTSGELRVSNFLLWQLAYTEFYFPIKLFPDFEEADLIDALSAFQRRRTNFGGRNK